jgi:hypothetical protein
MGLSEIQKLRMLGKKVLRRILGNRREDVIK